MSINYVTAFAVTCDQCGRQSHPARSKERLLNELADSPYPWQVTDDHQYCPEHWHAHCAKCDATDTGMLDMLLDEGWERTDDGFLCPECAASTERP